MPDVVIVGAGFAGAATAYHLATSTAKSIVVLESERFAGAHASGRNASLLLQPVADAELRRPLTTSRLDYEGDAERYGFDRCGSLLLGAPDRLEALADDDLFTSRRIDADEARRRAPLISGHDFDAALLTPSDGVVDIARLLQFYLEEARVHGAELRFDSPVTGIGGDGPYGLETPDGELEATVVVDAAGAWAGRVAEMAGATELPLVPWKRHLFVLDGSTLPPGAPFVWNVDRDIYFRREAGGLLLSICDESRSSSLVATVEPGISERMASVVTAELPRLAEVRQRSAWSCFRTKAPDGRFIIGWDPRRHGFFWVAALGGHGMGASWAVGEIAAARIAAGPEERSDSGPFSPDRF